MKRTGGFFLPSAILRSASNSAGFDLVPGLEDYALGINFGEIWARPALDVKTRRAITVGGPRRDRRSAVSDEGEAMAAGQEAGTP